MMYELCPLIREGFIQISVRFFDKLSRAATGHEFHVVVIGVAAIATKDTEKIERKNRNRTRIGDACTEAQKAVSRV